jgi:hypothetical protein
MMFCIGDVSVVNIEHIITPSSKYKPHTTYACKLNISCHEQHSAIGLPCHIFTVASQSWRSIVVSCATSRLCCPCTTCTLYAAIRRHYVNNARDTHETKPITMSNRRHATRATTPSYNKQQWTITMDHGMRRVCTSISSDRVVVCMCLFKPLTTTEPQPLHITLTHYNIS